MLDARASLVNIGVTACLYGLSVGVMTEGHSDKKCFDIKCVVTYGVCKTLEPNKSLYRSHSAL